MMDPLDKKRDYWRQQCEGAIKEQYGFSLPMIAFTASELLQLLDRLDEAEEQRDLNHKKWEAAESDADYWLKQNEDRRKEINELSAQRTLERDRAQQAEADAHRWMKKEWDQQQRAFVAEEKLNGIELMKWGEEVYHLQHKLTDASAEIFDLKRERDQAQCELQDLKARIAQFQVSEVELVTKGMQEKIDRAEQEADDLQRMIDYHYAPRAIEAEHRANKEIGRLGNRLGEERAYVRKIEFEMEELLKATEWRLDKEREELNLYQQAVNDFLNDGIRSQRLGLLAKYHESWRKLRDHLNPTPKIKCPREVLWWKCSLNPDHDGECEWVHQS